MKNLHEGTRYNLIREVLPVRDVGVRVLVPQGRRVKRVYVAPEMLDLPATVDGQYVEVRVPEIHIHAMVVVDLE